MSKEKDIILQGDEVASSSLRAKRTREHLKKKNIKAPKAEFKLKVGDKTTLLFKTKEQRNEIIKRLESPLKDDEWIMRLKGLQIKKL